MGDHTPARQHPTQSRDVPDVANVSERDVAVERAESEIVVRIRRRRARSPWALTRSVSWAVVAVAGDPVLFLLPAFTLAGFVIGALGLGAPPRPEVIVPLIVPPPSDSFQDIGIVALTGKTGVPAWIARVVLALIRTGLLALLVALVVQRTSGAAASISGARRLIAGRGRTFLALGAVSFGYALLVSQQSVLDPTRDGTLSATALAVGMLVLPGAFAAAAVRRTGVLRSLAHGLAFPKPIGHVVLVFGYSAAVNGLYRVAAYGDSGRASALPLALYALITAFLTTVFVATLTRRYSLLRGRPNPPEGIETALSRRGAVC